MDRDLLAVQVGPILVELGVDHGIEAQRAHLVEDADGCPHLLEQRIGRADADIGLAADHGLGRDVLRLQVGDLDIDAALLGALQRRQEPQRLDRRDVAEGDADLAGGEGVGRQAAKADREHQSRAEMRRFPGQSCSGWYCHRFLPGRPPVTGNDDGGGVNFAHRVG